MIKHVVCFKLKDNSPEKCAEAKAVLLGMRGNVPQLRDITVDVDFLHSERSCDVMLTVFVDDAAALEAYQKDPYHCGTVKPYMHAVRSASVAIDAEV
ncbi:MAG: Dabb family protein [Oscillospiraceae bacterium]|nr:Dabb family protein [Oscillospiraceae bacterium]